MKAKITSKMNHDSLWVKIVFPDGEAVARVNRYSSTSKCKGKSEEVLARLKPIRDEMFQRLNSDAPGTYGEKLEKLVADLKLRFA